ncbi:MAG TPA: membrane protein insertion efficiency factor YidD [Accumulibacter sp.]|uniref:membrane protein insertion efficiency factor YidD n=1 Tax=Accumulibacter sp. TaxID=2053492 RepID=UPI002B81AFEC|nr:membrane protein insertion efficiency factor YidD [Accumulibacter sp.]HRF72590.1 membrane protein insertion efficiency factor YidD [Accumulibacter sp.]
MKQILLALIGLYRYALSPMLGRRCRFFPSCSEYAAEAVDKHGAGKGTILALQRLLRCHPWNPGGFDPVP